MIMASGDVVESAISSLGNDADHAKVAKEVVVTTTQQSHNSTIERETSEEDTGSEKGGGSDGNECRSLFQGINGSSGGQEEYNFTCQEPTFSRQTRASSAFLRSEIGTGVAVGCFYEIVHSELPPKPPIHLKNIRAVLVTEKSNHNITVRFPSVHSIRVYFQEEIRHRTLEHPALDEQLIMSSGLALKVLGRRIPPPEAENRKRLKNFWVVSANPSISKPNSTFPAEQTSRGSTSVLSCTGMMRWGMRRKVWYTNRRRGELLSLIPYGAAGGAAPSSAGENRLGKRTADIGENGRITKKVKFEKGRFGFINSKDRWSKERYDAAEMKLMDIMRENGAVIGNPILRPDLRNEARKHIGDTGLLDHLLKHMAGKIDASNGDRLCRRHNSNGAMEYWLEPAELADLRKQAGVKDPAWVPPPGWKPGDNPYQDPEAVRQLNELKEEVENLKKNMLSMLPAPTLDEEEEDANASSFKASPSGEESSRGSLEERYKSLLARQTRLEQQVHEISSVVKAIQEEVGRWRRNADNEDKEATEASATAPPPSTQVSGTCTGAAAIRDKQERGSCNQTYSSVRRSGFRICKPHGTFLWPDMSNSMFTTDSSQTAKPVENLFLVPTPTSPESNTNSGPPLVLALPTPSTPSSPVRPVPYKTPSGNLMTTDHSYQLPKEAYVKTVQDGAGSSSCITSATRTASPSTWLALATPCSSMATGDALQAL